MGAERGPIVKRKQNERRQPGPQTTANVIPKRPSQTCDHKNNLVQLAGFRVSESRVEGRVLGCTVLGS